MDGKTVIPAGLGSFSSENSLASASIAPSLPAMHRRFILLLLILSAQAGADVITDGSLGARGPVGKSGGDYRIRSSLGKKVGGNLFHSFEKFNLQSGESATFTGPNSVDNILARVTGGKRSTIDGTVRSTIPGANLFLMNPSGVVFGPNASLDLQGSFAVTSSDYLSLKDGGRFNARDFGADSLTAAPVSAYGFLNSAPRSLRLLDSSLITRDGRNISVVAGSIHLQNSAVAAPSGNATLFSAASAGEVPASFRALQKAPRASLPKTGAIQLQQTSLVSATGAGKGNLLIRGGKLIATGGSLISNSRTGDGSGGQVDVRIDRGLHLFDSQIRSFAAATGNGAHIQIDAGGIILAGPGTDFAGSVAVAVQPGASGNSGKLSIETGRLIVARGGQLFSNTLGAGDAGPLRIRANQIFVDDLSEQLTTGIFSNVQGGSTGSARGITLEAREIYINNGGQITADTFSSGHGSNLSIDASLLRINRGNAKTETGILQRSLSSGDAGGLDIHSDRVSLFGGGSIMSNTFAEGSAGDVRITARRFVLDDKQSGFTSELSAGMQENSSGRGGDLFVDVRNLRMFGAARISTDNFGTGRAGDVQVTSRIMTLDGEKSRLNPGIFATVQPGSPGGGGDLTVQAQEASLSGRFRISSDVFGESSGGDVMVEIDDLRIDSRGTTFASGIFANVRPGASGAAAAGDMFVTSENLRIRNGGEISGSTFGDGAAGTVTVQADFLRINHGKGKIPTGIFANVNPKARGDGGNLIVQSNELQIVSGGEISASTFSRGAGGSIRIKADTLSLLRRGATEKNGIFVDVNTDAVGHGGSIDVEAGTLVVRQGSEISSNTDGIGDSGSVRVRADSITLNGSNLPLSNGIFANVLPGSFGNGGDVSVEADSIALTGGSEISVNTFGNGNGGNLSLNADKLNLDGRTGEFETGVFALVQVGAVGDSGTLSVEADQLFVRGFARISSSTFGKGDSGTIRIAAHRILLSDSAPPNGAGIMANVYDTGIGDSGDIRIEAHKLEILDGSEISAATFNIGNGGNIRIDADQVLIDSQNKLFPGGIFANVLSSGHGDGGDIDVNAEELSLLHGGRLTVATFGTGAGGSIRVDAGIVRLDGRNAVQKTGIFADLQAGAVGDGGNIIVNADELFVTRGGSIAANTEGLGNGGDIRIEARSLVVDNDGSVLPTAITAAVTESGTGNGGDLKITSDSLSVRDGSEISATTRGMGHGGSVEVNSARLIMDREDGLLRNGIFADVGATARGDGGNIRVFSSNLELRNGSVISADTFGNGDGGNMLVSAGRMELDRGKSLNLNGIYANVLESGIGDGGDIRVRSGELSVLRGSEISSSTFGFGDGGSVDVRAGQLRLDSRGLETASGIYAAVLPTGVGTGGDITIRSKEMLLTRGGTISADTLGNGDGGSVDVTADHLRIVGRTEQTSAIFANTISSLGLGGSIEVQADRIQLVGQSALIAAAAAKSQPAGSVHVTADSLVIGGGGGITALSGRSSAGQVRIDALNRLVLENRSAITASAATDGGSVDLRVGELFYLNNSRLLSTAGEGGREGSGGNISVSHPDFIVLSRGRISANAALGQGGNIFLNADSFLNSGTAITASGTTSGTIEIRAPDLDLSNALLPITALFVDDTLTFEDRCPKHVGEEVSTFLVVGRGGVSGTPDDPQVETGVSQPKPPE